MKKKKVPKYQFAGDPTKNPNVVTDANGNVYDKSTGKTYYKNAQNTNNQVVGADQPPSFNPNGNSNATVLSPDWQPNADQVQTKNVNTYELNKGFQIADLAASGITYAANELNNWKNTRNERKKYIQELQNPTNTNNPVINDLPIYTKMGGFLPGYNLTRAVNQNSLRTLKGNNNNPIKFFNPKSEMKIEMVPFGGGPLNSEGAKEILKDGTVHGHPLTAKQKRYFGYIAGKAKYGVDNVEFTDLEKEALKEMGIRL